MRQRILVPFGGQGLSGQPCSWAGGSVPEGVCGQCANASVWKGRAINVRAGWCRGFVPSMSGHIGVRGLCRQWVGTAVSARLALGEPYRAAVRGLRKDLEAS